eukprot:5828241-Prymnesium_polylepis.1
MWQHACHVVRGQRHAVVAEEQPVSVSRPDSRRAWEWERLERVEHDRRWFRVFPRSRATVWRRRGH